MSLVTPASDCHHQRKLRQFSDTFRYVGNTMAAFVMQSLGCEVAALHTVHFSMRITFPMFIITNNSSLMMELEI